MSYTLTNGYAPRTFETILLEVIASVNKELGTSYTQATFEGTGLYKIFYGMIQQIMTAENAVSEIENLLEDFMRTTNEELEVPSSTVDGVMAKILDDLGYISSLKANTSTDAGEISLCVDIDETKSNYSIEKEKILRLLYTYLGASSFYNGTESGNITASNGQSFPIAYGLPVKKTTYFRVEVVNSENSESIVLTPNEIKDRFMKNFEKFYKLGYDLEPEKYLEIERDLPFASKIVIEYSFNGTSWTSDVYKSAYNEKIIVESIEVIDEE